MSYESVCPCRRFCIYYYELTSGVTIRIVDTYRICGFTDVFLFGDCMFMMRPAMMGHYTKQTASGAASTQYPTAVARNVNTLVFFFFKCVYA